MKKQPAALAGTGEAFTREVFDVFFQCLRFLFRGLKDLAPRKRGILFQDDFAVVRLVWRKLVIVIWDYLFIDIFNELVNS